MGQFHWHHLFDLSNFLIARLINLIIGYGAGRAVWLELLLPSIDVRYWGLSRLWNCSSFHVDWEFHFIKSEVTVMWWWWKVCYLFDIGRSFEIHLEFWKISFCGVDLWRTRSLYTVFLENVYDFFHNHCVKQSVFIASFHSIFLVDYDWLWEHHQLGRIDDWVSSAKRGAIISCRHSLKKHSDTNKIQSHAYWTWHFPSKLPIRWNL